MRASWKAFPLRHLLVSTRPIKAAALIPAWFAMSLAVPAMLAQAPATSAAPATTAPAPPAQHRPHASSPGGPHEGIQVHGHWTIEVKNPDGAVVTHREFENKLEASFGGPTLAQILSGAGVLSEYAIAVPVPCSGASNCIFAQTGGASLGNNLVPIADDVSSAFGGAIGIECGSQAAACPQTLQVSNTYGAANFTLTGSATASSNGKVGGVESLLGTCRYNEAPSICIQADNAVSPLTGTLISPAVAFSKGQTVTVMVTISFQ
jgi:hypothetical protein